MSTRAYDIVPGSNGGQIRVRARGSALLAIPRLNRGTAFTHAERRQLGLLGRLPTGVTSLEAQVGRCYDQFRRARTDLEKFAYLAALRDRNTVLFYRLLAEHLEEMMPIVYTPTIGDAIVEFSHWYQRINGVFLSIDAPEQIDQCLQSTGRDAQDIDLIIVTDSEGILGIGDQGVGGIQIALGKKSLYTAAAGLDPNRALAVVLDVGTDNLALLNDEMYLGLRHSRVRGPAYDEFVEQFVTTAVKTFPHAMIHWEDFGASNAHRILATYQDKCLTFNDDIQGTAAVVAAAALAAVRTRGEQLRDQRIVIHGAGTAGVGVADLLRAMMIEEGATDAEARATFWGLGSRGLLTTALGERMRPFQVPYARPAEETADWKASRTGVIGLAEVVRRVHPTILIGTSGQPASFTQAIVTDMAAHTDRPVIFPLSNPTELAEATPADLLAWTDGRALIATGSPFAPVEAAGLTYRIAQANNAFVFPGLGLGVAVCHATRVSQGMIAAAATAVASMSKGTRRGQSLLPDVADLRVVSATVAIAVVRAAVAEGLAQVEPADPIQEVFDTMWKPVYPELLLD